MKRVLLFATAYLPFIGGAEVAVKEITDRLSEFEFVMITARLRSDLPAEEKIGNVTVKRIGKGNRWDKFRLILQAKKHANALGNFDMIWSIMASYGGFAALRVKKNHPSIPFLLTLQEGDSRAHIYSRVWWCWPYFVQIFRQADFIQAISTYLRDWAKSLKTKVPIEVIANGVETKMFSLSESKEQMEKRLREKLSLPPNTRILVTVSRLVPKNGVEDVIRAVEFLPQQYHLLILGDGYLSSSLESLAREKHIEERVHFLGSVQYEEIPPFLWGSTIFCRPSLTEGLGNAFLEAMAAGIPVIGTPVGGIVDFLKEGETGWFVSPKNPEQIAEVVKKIENESVETRNAIVERAKQVVDEKYSWDTIAEKMKKIFQNLL